MRVRIRDTEKLFFPESYQHKYLRLLERFEMLKTGSCVGTYIATKNCQVLRLVLALRHDRINFLYTYFNVDLFTRRLHDSPLALLNFSCLMRFTFSVWVTWTFSVVLHFLFGSLKRFLLLKEFPDLRMVLLHPDHSSNVP